MESLTIQDARKKFPFLKTDVYLDTASASLAFEGLEKATSKFYTDHKMKGIQGRQDWRNVASQCKEKIAQLIHAESSELIFLSSTTEGINMFANLIEWQEGDEIIIADNEFPSNIYPWTNTRKRGVRIKVVKSINGNLPTKVYRDSITAKTKLIAFSHINRGSGYKIDLDDMYDLCQKRDILLCADVCQSLCAVPVDARRVDLLSSSVFKWPLGPFGLSVCFINERVADRLLPNYLGYGSVKNESEAVFDDPKFKEGSLKFQYAHINYPGTYALNESLALFDSIGMEKVYDYISKLVQFLIGGLKKQGVSVVTPEEVKYRGGIVSFELENPGRVLEILEDEKVHVSLKDNRMRVSPHFYNNESDILRFLETLKSAQNIAAR